MKEEEIQMGPERRRKKAERNRELKKKQQASGSSASREGLLFSVHVVGWLATS